MRKGKHTIERGGGRYKNLEERENQVIVDLQGPMMAGGWSVRTGQTGGDAEVAWWPGQGVLGQAKREVMLRWHGDQVKKGLSFRHLSMKRV